MNLEDRLETLARYHEDAAHSVRTTLALLMNGARVTAAKSLGGKLKTAIALRNGNGSAPPHDDDRGPFRPGSLQSRLVKWLAQEKDPQTIGRMRQHFGVEHISIDGLVKRGLVKKTQAEMRPHHYTATETGREAVTGQLQAAPRKRMTRKKKGKKVKRPSEPKAPLLAQLRSLMKDMAEPVDWAGLLAAAKKKGVTAPNPQTVGSAIRYGHIESTGPERHRRYRWIA